MSSEESDDDTTAQQKQQLRDDVADDLGLTVSKSIVSGRWPGLGSALVIKADELDRDPTALQQAALDVSDRLAPTPECNKTLVALSIQERGV